MPPDSAIIARIQKRPIDARAGHGNANAVEIGNDRQKEQEYSHPISVFHRLASSLVATGYYQRDQVSTWSGDDDYDRIVGNSETTRSIGVKSRHHSSTKRPGLECYRLIPNNHLRS